MRHQTKFFNTLFTLEILVCLCSLIRVGYSPFPIILIGLALLKVYLFNFANEVAYLCAIDDIKNWKEDRQVDFCKCGNNEIANQRECRRKGIELYMIDVYAWHCSKCHRPYKPTNVFFWQIWKKGWTNRNDI